MKKLLKLLFVLSGTTALPLSVIACGQESLDSTLNVINKGATQYSIDELLEKPVSDYQEKYTLSTTETNTLAKEIAKTILKNADNETEIIWADENPAIGQQVYSVKITNGTKDKEDENLIWDVYAITGRIEIKISYLVGTINSENKFDAKQQINMIFKIKTCTTESDTIVSKWVNDFNQLITDQEWDTNALVINLKEGEIDLPSPNVKYSDLDKKIKEETQNTIQSYINTNTVTWMITNEHSLDDDLKLKLSLSANKNDAIKKTNDFYIQFKQIKN